MSQNERNFIKFINSINKPNHSFVEKPITI